MCGLIVLLITWAWVYAAQLWCFIVMGRSDVLHLQGAVQTPVSVTRKQRAPRLLSARQVQLLGWAVSAHCCSMHIYLQYMYIYCHV
jgi:hypothetical protein